MRSPLRPSPALLVLGGLAALAGLAVLEDGRGDRGSARAAACVRRSFDFLDDEGEGRVLSTLGIELSREADGARLLVTSSAVGPRVDPVPGFRGVQGANHVTALEQRELLERRRAELATADLAGGEVRSGRIRAGRWGRIPERRLRADGTIDYLAESEETFPLELVFDSGPLARGAHVARVSVDGHVRLSVGVEVGDVLRIRSVESVAHVEEHEVNP